MIREIWNAWRRSTDYWPPCEKNWKYYLCLRLLSISTSTCPIPWPEFISFLLQSLHFTPSVPFPPSPFLSSNLFLMVRSDDSNHVFDHALSWILFYFCVIPLPPQNCFLVAFPTLLFFCFYFSLSVHMYAYRCTNAHTHTEKPAESCRSRCDIV